MQIKLKMLAAGLLTTFSTISAANIQIFPAKGIFGMEQGCRQDAQRIEANGPSISCDFSKAIDHEATRQQTEKMFLQGLAQNQSHQLVSGIEQNTKHRTYVASLEVLRASKYTVNKGSTSEVFLPVTLSLKLTNILSGEVIYSDSATLSQPIQVLSTELDTASTQAAIAQQYRNTLVSLTQQVTQALKSKLQVTEIQTKVIDQWKSYLVLDKGYNQGIAKQDELTAEDGSLIRVVHADRDYAVALPVLVQGNPKSFSKLSTNTRQAMNKPRALVVDVLTYQGESKDLVEQIFSDAVGEKAAFSLTPVNHRYSQLAQSMGEQTKLAQLEDINQRELPEFFIRINVIPAISYQQQVGKITQQHVVHSEVFAEMTDRSGRVIYTAHATDKITDVVSSGMGFSVEARKEVALKNALLQLGQKFEKDIQFTRSDLSVSSSNSQTISIDDKGERLSPGMKVSVYHADRVAQRQILIPTWEATIIERSGSKATAQLDLPFSDNANVPVSKGDKILIDTHAAAGDSKFARMFCPDKATEQVSDIAFYGFGPMIHHAFAEHSKHPLYATGASFKGQKTLQEAVQYLTQHAGFKTQLKQDFYQPKGSCLQPVIKIQVKSDSVQCRNDNNCDATLVVTSGVRQFGTNGAKTGAYGLEQDINLKNIDINHQAEMYNIQMFEALPKILKTIVQKADSTSQ